MTAAILSQKPHRPAAEAPLLADLRLAKARCHEFCGNARHTLAMILAGAQEGPVLWIRPAWLPDALHGQGMVRFAAPGRFLFASPRRPEDLLWAMEEALRSGALPLVVADLPAPPPLTPVRRLHLAAETGAQEGRFAPLGLLLTPGEGGAQGVESRWQFTCDHGGAQERWRLTRSRARTAPPKSWHVTPRDRGFAIAPCAA
ncbi:hypothetical protein PSA7680_02951 [Pseudoruegeria aquimaris]|uniref:Protein ImuA n=1 Tax=Pseudoruegeria aquimaris TaxID=393663 RepID=A0A1Y5T923_9RHOB|nr:hypothetical protein [Pseudoruegeria aquimaris]SLN56748.1 hypothetical protein PSA7680_02951 [Pseudoruegeria aquimaris]